MKRSFIITMMIILMSVSMLSAETTPEDILKAVDQMTPEQAHELQKKISKRQWEPVPAGFFDRLAIKGSMNYQSLKDVNISSLNLSSGKDLDLETIAGTELGILWQLFNDRFRAGFQLGTLAAEDSDMSETGYSSVEMTFFTVALIANYQLVKSDKFIWWTEASLGGGSIDMEVLDTPTGGSSTLARYDEGYEIGSLTTGIDWRFNSELSLNLYAGYQFSEDVKMEQADQSTGVKVDLSGVKGGIGLCYNF